MLKNTKIIIPGYNLVTTKQTAPTAVGIWQDTYIYPDGSKKVMPWRKNQIQNNAANIAAKLISFSRVAEFAPDNGFMFLALGQGDPSWDLTPPVLPPTSNMLFSEIDRIAIQPVTDITYLDPITELPSATETRMVEIAVLIGLSDGIGELREFGLVVGNASTTPNSGSLFNWVRHPLITKVIAPNPTEILRKIRIKWLINSEVTIP